MMESSAKSSLPANKLFIACSDNKTDDVARLLMTMTVEEINQIQSNGLTALHAASYYGNNEIVRLLIEHGASRAIMDKCNRIPYDVAKNEQIKQQLILYGFVGNKSDLLNNDRQQERFFRTELPTEPYNNLEILTIFSVRWHVYIGQITINELIELATQGIIIEGEKINKGSEAMLLASQLINVKRQGLEGELPIGMIWDNDTGRVLEKKGEKEIYSCAISIYTKDTFLYKLLNETLRHNDYSKVTTLGPFNALLTYPYRTRSFEKDWFIGTLYRGANLESFMIACYKNNVGKVKQWNAFASTSKNRNLAEWYGNVVFIITVPAACRCNCLDISAYSNFPEEEEVLMSAGTKFLIERIECNRNSKYHIYLTIRDDME